MFLGKSIGGQSRLTIHTLVWGLLCLCAMALFPGGKAEAQTVTTYSNNSTISIPDNACPATVNRTFSVGTSYIIGDVDIGVLVDHTYRRDLEITLTSPTGTVVTLMDYVGGSADNLNVRFDDEGTDGTITSHTSNDSLTPVYSSTRTPQRSLSAFDGQNAQGTWTLKICDQQGVDTGSFRRADLYITQLPSDFADLSLTKTVSNASPVNGANITYTLSLTNSAVSNQTAAATVKDLLPLGLSFVSASGYGTYSSGTGIWTISSIAPGQTRSLSIVATVTATSAATITNVAEVASSDRLDPDSTPNNASAGEDDYASRSITVSGARTAGIAPSLTSVCPITNQILFDWNGKAWSGGSTNNSYNLTGIGSINFAITKTGGSYDDGSPAVNNNNYANLSNSEQSLYENLQFSDKNQTATTVLTLPTAVPGLQFTVFDIDFNNNDFADKLTVVGSFNGTTVLPTLTNGVANYVIGNVAIGDSGSNSNSANGNVVVTFTSLVDKVEIIYGNHTTAPDDPDGQAISIHDINFCRPATTLSVTKVSSIISDPVNGTTNPKRIPDAIVQYCILISNSGSASADAVAATDNLSGPFTYTPGSMRSGSNCGSAATVEDDNATGADESDPYGASLTGSTITATAATLGPAASFALTFQVTID